MKNKPIKKIILSRTDAIGDVVLTLPMAVYLKKKFGEEIQIAFLGKTYTYPVINSCPFIDEFYNYDSFEKYDEKGRKEFLQAIEADTIVHVFPRENIARSAKAAGIRQRVGTYSRLYHWWTCNRLLKINRKNSPFHEAQLNMLLLRDFGMQELPSKTDLQQEMLLHPVGSLPEKISDLLRKDRFRLILHPKSNVSAREWSLDHYKDLIRFLDNKKAQVLITGTKEEGERMQDWLKSLPNHVVNLAGALQLDELLTLIRECNGLVAASTGPLHLAAAMGKRTIGIYPPIRPMHPGRWAPLGNKAEFIVLEKSCSDCRSNPSSCYCMNQINAAQVAERIRQWIN